MTSNSRDTSPLSTPGLSNTPGYRIIPQGMLLELELSIIDLMD